MGRFGWLFACGCMVASPWASGAAATGGDSVAQGRWAFAIPSQPLAPALIAYGGQANVQVLVAGELAATLRSSPVQGEFGREDALAALLKGTGLTYRFLGVTTVVIKPAAGGTVGDMPPVPVTELAPVQALGLFARGYRPEWASGSARLDSDLADLPQSVGVVTHELMDARQDRTVADALRTVAGVQYLDSWVGLPQFLIRGFHTGNGMTDGMPNSVVGVGDTPPLIAVERIEVPRGPQAILGDVSANNNFGGLVGLIMKKPQAQPVRQLTWALGSQGDGELGGDFAGRLDHAGHWLYRGVFSLDRTDRTPQGYVGRRTNYVAPSLGWNGRDTQWIVGFSRMVNRFPTPDHVMWLDDTPASASPEHLLLGHPQDHSQFRTSRYYYLFEHTVDETWSFRSRAHYVHETGLVQGWTLDSLSGDGIVSALADKYRYSDAYYSLQNDLVATFELGAMRHTVLFGVDYSRARVGRIEEEQATLGDGTYDLYGGNRLPSVSSLPLAVNESVFSGDPWVTDSGVFVQDQVQVGERWHALVAVRRSAYVLSTEHMDGTPWERRKAQWVPNLGVVYKARPGIALYASLTHGFQPDTVLGQNGSPLLPTLSRQVEAGAKFDLAQDRARLTVAWYRIALDHSTDLFSPKPPYFGIPGPGQTNKGVEVELNGRIAPGLDLSASYAYARVRNHDGSPATGAPRHRMDAWASYAFAGGWSGWGVGAGLHVRSRAIGLLSDGVTTFRNAGQYSVDANVFYRAPRWSVTLGVRNVLGRRLRAEDFDDTFVPLFARRSVLLSGTYTL